MRHATLPFACVLLVGLSYSNGSGQDKIAKQDLTSAPKGFDAKRDGIAR